MSKPLHKDISFWTVAIVLVGAANILQLSHGIPWFKQRLADSKPAPRSPAPEPRLAAQTFLLQQQQQLDFGKKTYDWQKPRPDGDMLAGAASQVIVIPSEYSPPSGGWWSSRMDKAIGVRVTPEVLIQVAYRANRNRMVLPPDMPRGQYDFIANLPTGSMEALREEIRKKLGLDAALETLSTNVLVLSLHHTNAPGLKPSGNGPLEQGIVGGGQILRTRSNVASLIPTLESLLRMPVIDHTGLTGAFDIQFPMPRSMPGQPADRVRQISDLIRENLGLELVETNAPIEMLVVRKMNPAPTAQRSQNP